MKYIIYILWVVVAGILAEMLNVEIKPWWGYTYAFVVGFVACIILQSR